MRSPVAAVVPSNPQSGISCPVSPELALSEGFGEKFPSQNLEAREEARHDRFFFSRCSSCSREDRQWTTGETGNAETPFARTRHLQLDVQ